MRNASSVAQAIAAKRAAKDAAEFPIELALHLLLLLDPDSLHPVSQIEHIIDWLSPIANGKQLPAATQQQTDWLGNWKTLAIAQRLDLRQSQIVAALIVDRSSK